MRTAPGRLLAAIRARAAVGLRPLALVSCDNLIDNGSTLAKVVADLADVVGDDNAALVAATSFVHTMVDRITPHTTDVERADISRLTGLADADPIACEPFTEWILAGEFPSGRPAWELGGARFTDDVKPFEQRKLWMLNATHSLLAYVGGLRGHETVDQAMGDEVCTALVTSWWEDAEAQIDLPAQETATYAQDLLARYSNTSVQHRLAQIAGDGSQKLPIRIAPVLLATRAAGGRGTAGVTTLAAYRPAPPRIRRPGERRRRRGTPGGSRRRSHRGRRSRARTARRPPHRPRPGRRCRRQRHRTRQFHLTNAFPHREWRRRKGCLTWSTAISAGPACGCHRCAWAR